VPSTLDALSQTDRAIEQRLRNVGVLLKRDPELVDKESLIWLLGALLSQRDRYSVVLKQGARELASLESDKHELIALMTAYAEIRSL
jgi:hypothetical protein